MQQIEYITPYGSVVADDVGTGSINGTPRCIWLNDFDGNSLGTKTDAVECVDIPGQLVLNITAKPRMIVAKIGFAPDSGRTASQYELRRELLRLFPLKESGELIYRNNSGEFRITARVTDIPSVKYVAGAWAEASVYFTADYPFWEYPSFESEETSGGELVLVGECDMDSPLEIQMTALTDVERFFVREYAGRNNIWHGINSINTIPEGTTLLYDIGTRGGLYCYVLNGQRRQKAPQYWDLRGYEKLMCNKPDGQTLVFGAESGSFTAKVIYHNIAATV